MINGAPFTVEYKFGDGSLAIDRINDDLKGTTEQTSRTWLERQTIFEPFYLPSTDTVYFLSYAFNLINTPENNPVILTYEPNRSGRKINAIWTGNWEANWAIIKPFYLADSTYLFSYSPALLLGDATVAIDRVNTDGKGTSEVWRHQGWANDWKYIEPFYMNGNTYLMEFAPTTTVAFDQVNANGQGTTEIWRGNLVKNYDLAKIFYSNGNYFVLAYSTASGGYEIYQMNSNLKGFRLVSEGIWAPGGILEAYQSIEPFYKGNNTYFFACNFEQSLLPADYSAVAIGQFMSGSNTINTLWTDNWSGGWTQVKPFYFPPIPYPPVISNQ